MDVSYNGNLDDFYDSIGKAIASEPADTATCIFRFVRMNRSLKSVDEMANEIMQYGWSDSHENAIEAIKSNLLLAEPLKQKEPPSLFDGIL